MSNTVPTVRLNGWQRVWIVVAVAWTMVAASSTWSSWPTSPGLPAVSIFLSGHIDPNTRRMPEIDYYYALAVEKSGGESEPPNASPERAPMAVTGLLVAIPEVGAVRFPDSMSQDQVRAASKELYEGNRKVVQEFNQERLHKYYVRRNIAVKRGTALWLVPLVALYGFGWSVGWIRRGFRYPPNEH